MTRSRRAWVVRMLLLAAVAAAVPACKKGSSDAVFTLPIPGTLGFASATFTVAEEGGTATITVSRSGGTLGAVNVSYATSNGSATGADYTPAAGTLFWADGEGGDKTFTVAVTGDASSEGDETVNLTLTLPSGGASFGLAAAILSILDNDTPSGTGVLQFGAATYSVDEGAGSLTVTVTRTGGSIGPASATVAGAGNVADWSIASPALSWAAGETGPKTVAMAIVDDALGEGAETVNLSLTGLSGATAGTQATSVVTIIDNDSPGTIALSSATYSTNESGTSATITVTRTGGSGGAVGVNFATANGTATLVDNDYAAASGTLSWADGETGPKTFTVPVVDNTVVEADETVNLSISSPSGGATLGTAAATLTIVNDDTSLQFSAATYSVAESGVTATITATRLGTTVGAVGVTWATSDGTALAASDYTAGTNTLAWGNGDGANKTFTVAITNDAVSEGSETVNLALSAPTGGATLGAQSSAVLTILDNPGVLQFSAATYSVNEAGTSIAITVTRTQGRGGAATVNFGVNGGAPGTATGGGTDYAILGTMLSWGDQDGSDRTFTVTIANETAVEGNETVGLLLSGATGASVGAQSTAVLTIVDNDVTVQYALSSQNVNENEGPLVVTATRVGTSVGQVTVSYTYTDQTASYLTDYTYSPVTITWPDGDMTDKTYNVAITNDGLVEGGETFILNLSGPAATLGTQVTIGTPASTTVTIVDDDAPNISISDASASEPDAGGLTYTFTVTLSQTAVVPAVITYSTADGTATTGNSDYVAVPSTTLTIPAGQTSGQITVTVNGDMVDEADETFVVNLTGATNANLTDNQAVGTIVNEDNPTITIADNSVAEGLSGATPLNFTVTLSNASYEDVVVTYSTANGTATTANSDYTAVPSTTLTIPAGQLTGQIPVSVTGDTTDEAAETFVVNLTGATNATISDTQATGTITNDDDPTVTISAAAAATEGNSGTKAFNFTVTLSNASFENVTVTFQTVDGTATTANNDYVAIPSSNLVITAGLTAGTATVLVNGDGTDELNETFSVTLLGATNATLGGTFTAASSITNDDDPTISINNVLVNEGPFGTANAVFTVTLSNASLQDVTVDFATSNGTATLANNDYVAVPTTTLTIPALQLAGQITVQVNGDQVDEASETFFVDLSNPGNATILDNQGQGTITNDDDPEVTINNVTLAEGNSGQTSFVFTVTLSRLSLEPVVVDFNVANGTATLADSDYQAPGAVQVTINSGLTGQITVLVNGDANGELNETFFVNLTGATNATILDNQGQGTITNDDVPAATISDVSVTESDGGTVDATFTVTLSTAPLANVTVNYVTQNNTATTGNSDYTQVVAGQVTVLAGATTAQFSVSVIGDSTDEADETFFVNLAAGAGYSIADGQGVATILNDDDPTISIDDVSLAEGQSSTKNFTFTITLSNASLESVTVQFATSNLTATAGSDYTAASGTATLTGVLTTSFNVVVSGDTTDEFDETFRVLLSGATNATIADNQGLGTIQNDDDPAVSSVTGPAATTEGNSGTKNFAFTINLSSVSNQDVTVSYQTSNGTATSGSGDYVAANASVLIPAGQTQGTVNVVVNGDGTDEANETFSLGVTGAINATVPGSVGATATITNDDNPSISINDVSDTEGPNSTTKNFTFTVTLSNPSLEALAIGYSTSANSPTIEGSDYAGVSGGILNIPGASAQTTFTFSIVVNGDSIDELNETFNVNLAAGTGYSITDGTGLGTIQNDDEPTLTILPVSMLEGSPSGTTAFVFDLNLSNSSEEAVVVTFSTSDGTATSGSGDYVAQVSQQVTIPGNHAPPTGSITILVNQDGIGEPDETFTVTVSSATNALLGGSPLQATGTIENDDAPVVTIADVSVSEGIPTGAMTFTVTVTGLVSGTVIIDLNTQSLAVSNAATEGGVDYFTGTTPSQLTFNAEGSQTVTVGINNTDTTDELDEIFEVHLSPNGASTSPFTITDDVAVGTILDDDGPLVNITGPLSSISEGSTGGTVQASFTISLSGTSVQNVTVSYATQDGVAVAGRDYTSASGTATIAAGQVSTTLVISVLSDTRDDNATEDFSVNLSSPVNASLGTSSASAVILDDDAQPTVSINNITVAEGTGGGTTSATFTISLSAVSDLNVGVSFATSGGNATPGGDYTAVGPTLVGIPFGTLSTTVSVTVARDSNDEIDETFNGNLSGAVNATISGPGFGICTIDDDDGPQLVFGDVQNPEGTGVGTTQMTLFVSPSFASAQSMSVQFSITAGSASTPGDWSPGPGNAMTGVLNFGAGSMSPQQINITVVTDGLVETDETVTVTFSNPVDCSLTTTTATITIQNDDFGPTVTTFDPFNGSNGVPITTPMKLTFSEAMIRATVEANTTMVPAPANGIVWAWESDLVAWMVFDTVNPPGIQGFDLLAEAQSYTVTVGMGAQGQSGFNVPSLQSATFTTRLDVTPPEIVSVATIGTPGGQDPQAGLLTGTVTGFTVTFSEDMDQTRGGASIGGFGLDARDEIGTTGTGMTVTWTGLQTFEVSLAQPLVPGARYSLSIFGMSDNGPYFNNMDGWSRRFPIVLQALASDTNRPTVTGSAPFNTQTDVPRGSGAFIVFSEVMHPDLLSHVTVTANPGPVPPLVIEYGAYVGGLEVSPLSAWPANSLVTITVAATARDTRDNTLLAPYVLQFTTDAAGGNAISVNADYSGFKDGATNMGTGFWNLSFVRFKETASGAHASINLDLISTGDFSLLRRFNAGVPGLGLPMKGYRAVLEEGGDVLQFGESPGASSGSFDMQWQMGETYELTFRSTIQSFTGGTFAQTVFTFSTAPVAGDTRPSTGSPPEVRYYTRGTGVFVGLSVWANNYNAGASQQTALTVTDPPPPAAAVFSNVTTQPAGNFNYDFESASAESGLSTPGLHVANFQFAEPGPGGAAFSIRNDAYVFSSVPTLGVSNTTTPFPTYTFGGIPADAHVTVLVIKDSLDRELFFWLFPPTGVPSFTQPPEYPLPNGNYTATYSGVRFLGGNSNAEAQVIVPFIVGP